MGYMEVSLQSTNSLKIRGKHASLFVNPQDKTATYNMAILLANPTPASLKIRDDVVIIDGPGEYEAGGIKVSGIKSDKSTVYSITIDNIEVVLGNRDALEKVHQKLREHHVALIHANDTGNASFAPSLGLNAILIFGEHAQSTIDTLAKDEKKQTTKYSFSADKLPTDTETVLLTSA